MKMTEDLFYLERTPLADRWPWPCCAEIVELGVEWIQEKTADAEIRLLQIFSFLLEIDEENR